MTPSPQPGLRAHKGTLWDPAAEIAPGQVAGNSNLKLGDRARSDPLYYLPYYRYCFKSPVGHPDRAEGEGSEGLVP